MTSHPMGKNEFPERKSLGRSSDPTTYIHNRWEGLKPVRRVKAKVENEDIQTEFKLVRILAEKGRQRNMAADRGH